MRIKWATLYSQRKVREGERLTSFNRAQAYITHSHFVWGRRVSDPMRSSLDYHSTSSNQ